MGRRHAAAIHAAQKLEDINFAGIFDPQKQGYETLVDEEGKWASKVPYFNRIDELMAVDGLNAIVIATTAPYHFQYLRQAADHGKISHVLVEKPLCSSISQAEEIDRLALASGMRIAVNHQWPFFPSYRQIKKIANSPAFGGVCSASIMAGNFGLAMGGSHAMFLFQWIAETQLTHVNAWLEMDRVPNPRGQQFEDRAGDVRLQTQNSDQSLYVSFTSSQHHGISDVWCCKYGQIIIDRIAAKAWLSSRKEDARDAPSTRYVMPADAQMIELEEMDLIASSRDHLMALINGEEIVTHKQGAHIIRLLAACYASSEQGGAMIDTTKAFADPDRIFNWC